MATDTPRSGDREHELQTAYLILLAGGLVGGALVLSAVITSYWWWGPLLQWLEDGTREKLWQPVLAIVGLLVGLAIMFAAFQAARKFERVNVTLRRVLYGYNTFLTTFLVLLLLVVINVFVQMRYPLPFDTTEGGFYSLGEKTRQWVADLEQPVEVYMLLDQTDDAYADMKTVLTQMESVNPRYFQFEEVAIDGTNNSMIRDLQKRFKFLVPRPGLLVAYGDKPENNHSYISSSELTNFEFVGPNREPQREFRGEVRLMQELYFLAEDKRKPVIYFTQGHGEPELSDRGPEGLAELVQRLTQANYDVRPLTTTNPDPEKNSVPADADVVVIVGPKRGMNDLVPALRRYMTPTDPNARKGNLVVFLGPTGADRQRAGQMVETGLEPLLREFNVNVTNDAIYMVRGLDGTPIERGGRIYLEAVFVAAADAAVESRHPVAQLSKEGREAWVDVRHLEPLASSQPGTKFQAEPVLVTSGYCWLEGDMGISASQSFERMREQGTVEERIKRDRFPVAISVSEVAESTDPHAVLKPNQGRKPRLMVFGCSTITANPVMRPQSAGIEFDLIRGSIDWCRERYGQIGVEPKSYRYFAMPKDTSYWNLFYLPLAAMTLAVLGLGLIVWNARRT